MSISTFYKNRRSVKERRSGKDRRVFSYSAYFPERRSTNDRRFVYFRRCG